MVNPLHLQGECYPGCSGWAEEPWDVYREMVLAQARGLREGAAPVLGFESAAVVHGLPVMGSPPPQVQFVRPGNGGGRRTRYQRVRALPLEASEITMCSGVALTSVARTIFDLAATTGRENGLVLADHALREGLCEMADIRRSLTLHPNRHGRAGVQFVLSQADGRSRSVATSYSRYLMWTFGDVPRPQLAVPVLGFFDDPLGVADFTWNGGEVLGFVTDLPAFGPSDSPSDEPAPSRTSGSSTHPLTDSSLGFSPGHSSGHSADHSPEHSPHPWSNLPADSWPDSSPVGGRAVDDRGSSIRGHGGRSSSMLTPWSADYGSLSIDSGRVAIDARALEELQQMGVSVLQWGWNDLRFPHRFRRMLRDSLDSRTARRWVEPTGLPPRTY